MILDEIVQKKKESLNEIKGQAQNLPLRQNDQKNFLKAITAPGLQIIAEVKEKSPSTGVLCSPYLPEKIAEHYKKGGAAAVSVLTDTDFFGGKMDDMVKVKQSTQLPILCKDFIIDEYQIEQAYAHGADAVLLIMRILTLAKAKKLKAKIESFNMTALIEIFDEADLEKALQISPQVLMINHRNLDTLKINYHQTDSLIDKIPQHIPVVAASGILKPEQVLTLHPRIMAVLIGTALLRSEDPETFIKKIKETKIKICGITNIDDALLAESLGAHFLGFIFEKSSPRYISYATAKKIISALDTAQSIGVFVDQDAEEITKIAHELNLWGVQIYSDKNFGHPNFRVPKFRIINSLRIKDQIEVINNRSCHYSLLDTHDPDQIGGTGKTWNWDLMPSSLENCFLSGGLNIDNIQQAKNYSPFAVDLSSGVETSPGKKDPLKLKKLFEVFYE